MSTFYLRTAADVPHRFNPINPDVSMCGRSLVGAKPVSDLQIFVYLGDKRCPACTPAGVGLRAANRMLPSRDLPAPLPDDGELLAPIEFPTVPDPALRGDRPQSGAAA